MVRRELARFEIAAANELNELQKLFIHDTFSRLPCFVIRSIQIREAKLPSDLWDKRRIVINGRAILLNDITFLSRLF